MVWLLIQKQQLANWKDLKNVELQIFNSLSLTALLLLCHITLPWMVHTKHSKEVNKLVQPKKVLDLHIAINIAV